jgi:hypothetical protein
MRDYDRRGLEAANPIMDLLKGLAARTDVTVIDPISSLCNAAIGKTSDNEGLPIYKDYNHLRASYASQHATFVDQVFK